MSRHFLDIFFAFYKLKHTKMYTHTPNALHTFTPLKALVNNSLTSAKLRREMMKNLMGWFGKVLSRQLSWANKITEKERGNQVSKEARQLRNRFVFNKDIRIFWGELEQIIKRKCVKKKAVKACA